MSKPRLLIVEDEQAIATLLLEVAQSAGFQTCIATSAHSFTTLYEAFQPQVMTLDILMPDMDGFDVLSYLHERECKARILLVSGSHEYRDMAARMGQVRGLSIVANLQKPFRPVDMKKRLKLIAREFQTDNQELAEDAA